MVETHKLVPNLSEMMAEYAAGEAEVHLAPQTETITVAKPEVQGKEQNQVLKRNKQERTELSRA